MLNNSLAIITQQYCCFGKKVIFTYLDNLPNMLIKKRRLNGWTQEQLAEKLGIKEQQVQRYESTKYQSASLRRLIEIAKILEIT